MAGFSCRLAMVDISGDKMTGVDPFETLAIGGSSARIYKDPDSFQRAIELG